MPWIEHVSRDQIISGFHHDAGANSMLIQIMDPASGFPTPKYRFKETHQFEFLDIEDDGLTNLGDGDFSDMGEWAITDQQAEQLVSLLKHALDNRMNTIIHCFAGMCRSTAVAVVGVAMGFDDVEKFRMPNRLVLNKMSQVLGIKVPANLGGFIERNGILIPPDLT
jgi:predicted protein tyrosine phosphatase